MFFIFLRDAVIAAIVLPIILLVLVLVTVLAGFIGIDSHAEWFSLVLIPFVIFGLYQLATLMRTGLAGVLAGFAVWGVSITIGYFFFNETLQTIGSWFDVFVS